MKKHLSSALAAALLILGAALSWWLRPAATAADAASGDKMYYALSLILLICAAVWLLCSLLPARRQADVHTTAMAAMFAALCYVGFAFLKIDIPVGTEKTAFHLGNVFCVLAALFLGGFWGGMAGAVGMTIGDLTSAYVTSAPKTFVMKLCIGLIVGFVAHKVLHISKESRRLPLAACAALASLAGMLFNTVFDPIVGFFYKTYVLGVPQNAAKIWISISRVTTAVNAMIAVVAATVLYLAIYPAARSARLLPKVDD